MFSKSQMSTSSSSNSIAPGANSPTSPECINNFRNSGDNNNNELENNVAMLKEYEERRHKLCKEMKKLTDCLNELNHVEKQLLQDLNSTTTHGLERLNLVTDKWADFMNEVSKNREDLATVISRTSVEPLKRFQNAFSEMRSAVKRYEQLLADHQKYSQKVAKYKDCERTSNVIIKLNDYQCRLAQAQSDLNTLRGVLDRELPMFLHKRLDYLQPSLAAFISAEILYSGNNLSALSGLQAVTDELTDAQRHERQSKLFDSIDSLSIVTS